jgi:enhancer of mRNA-decapping protein 3
MCSQYVGCIVSLDCGDSLGTYQGQVKVVDDSTQTLTITQAFRNGIRCEIPEITIT